MRAGPKGKQMKVHEALAIVMEDVRAVGKTERNTHQNYNFRGIDAVVNAVGPALRQHHVVVVPRVLSYEAENITVGRNSTQMRAVTVMVEYTFVGPEGDTLIAVSIGESMDSGDKAVAKAMSVALRTCLLQSLMLPTDEPDPDSFSYEREAAMVVEPAVSFDPGVPETWGDSVTVAQAKKIVLAATGNDKEAAQIAWEACGLKKGPIDSHTILEVMFAVADTMQKDEGRPF
jgi:hypothetical protein